MADFRRPLTHCEDGFSVSVQASEYHYCSPREDGYPLHMYDTVEVGYPSERPEPWEKWQTYTSEPDRPTDTVYGWVPLEMVLALIESHGGEV
jgi:hypothetical protein